MYLTAAGVGHLVLTDYDQVDSSNLQRQIVHAQSNIGQLKATSARETLLRLNPEVSVSALDYELDGDDLIAHAEQADILVDCTDNFNVRYAINDACLKNKTLLVSGAAVRMEGQLMVVDPTNPEMPCYRCLYGDAGETELNCATIGIAAPVVGTIGTLQALETLKLITGVGESLAGYLLTWDAKYMEWRKLKLAKNPDCIC